MRCFSGVLEAREVTIRTAIRKLEDFIGGRFQWRAYQSSIEGAGP
jgi:hypothetical protein